jgi:hypothetical protein
VEFGKASLTPRSVPSTVGGEDSRREPCWWRICFPHLRFVEKVCGVPISTWGTDAPSKSYTPHRHAHMRTPGMQHEFGGMLLAPRSCSVTKERYLLDLNNHGQREMQHGGGLMLPMLRV